MHQQRMAALNSFDLAAVKARARAAAGIEHQTDGHGPAAAVASSD